MPVTIPDTADGLRATLDDKAALAEVTATPAALAEFVAAYAAKTTRRDPEIVAQTRDLVAEGIQAWHRDHGDQGGPAAQVVPGQRRAESYNPRAAGAALDGIAADAEAFFAALRPRPDAAGLAARERMAEIQASFGTTVPSDGGFLVPEVLRSQLLQTALESSIVRSRATTVPMDSQRVPFPMIDETTHSGSVRGGIVGYWTEEAGALTESQATFGRVVLDARKLTGYAVVPRELMQDSILAFTAWVQQAFPEALSFFEDIAFISGSGADRPLGYLDAGNTALVTVAKESGQTAGTIVWENILEMYSRLLPTSLGSSVWIASIDTFRQLATMALSVGTGGGPVWIGGMTSPGASTPPMSILGRPVIFTEKHPALGSKGDIALVDLKYYLVGDRQQLQADVSEHYRFANDQTAIRFIQRVDGRPWIKSAITPANGSSRTLSPFVTLAAR